MNIDELFATAESAEKVARMLRRDIALIQRDCPHKVCEPDGMDADDFLFERCTACRLSAPKPMRRRKLKR